MPKAPGMPFAPADGADCSAPVAFDNINTGMQIVIMMRKPRLMAAAKIA